MSESSYEKMLRKLNDGSELTYDQIADTVEVGRRQARRLVAQARDNGVGIEQRREGRQVVFYIPTDKQVRESMIDLTEEEILALCVAADAARASLCSTPLLDPLDSAVTKLTEEIGTELMMLNPDDDREHWHFTTHPVAQIDPDVFRQLSDAVQACQEIDISYDSASSGKHYDSRRIDPYGMSVFNGSWTLLAWCHLNRDFREFSIPAIGNVRPVGTFFVRREELDLQEYFRGRFGGRGGSEIRKIELRVDERFLHYFRRKKYHASQKMSPCRNGHATISFQVMGLDDIAAFVRSWGEGVKVLHPKELADRIAREAEGVCNVYRNGETI